MNTGIKLSTGKAAVFFTSQVQGVAVRWATVNKRHLLAFRDLVVLTGYRKGSKDALRTTIAGHGYDLKSQLTRLLPPGQKNGLPMDFMDVRGLQFVCSILPPDRTVGLREWLSARTELPPESFLSQESQAKIFTAVLGGCTVRMAYAKGQAWISIADVEPLLGYRGHTGSKVRLLCERKKVSIIAHQIALRFAGFKPYSFINAEGLCQVCKLIEPPKRTAALRAWVERYGTWSASAAQLISEMTGEKVQDASIVALQVGAARPEATRGKTRRISAAREQRARRVSPRPASSREAVAAQQLLLPGVVAGTGVVPVKRPVPTLTTKNYCRKLCAVLTRYLTDDEVGRLLAHMEGVKGDVLANRYDPLLNDAAYALYANYRLRSAQAVAGEQGGA